MKLSKKPCVPLWLKSIATNASSNSTGHHIHRRASRLCRRADAAHASLLAGAREFRAKGSLDLYNNLGVSQKLVSKGNAHVSLSLSGLCRASPLTASDKRVTSTYLSIGDGLAVLVLIDYSRLLVNGLGKLCLGHFLRGASLLDGLAKTEADLLVCEAQVGAKCEVREKFGVSHYRHMNDSSIRLRLSIVAEVEMSRYVRERTSVSVSSLVMLESTGRFALEPAASVLGNEAAGEQRERERERLLDS